MKSKSLDRPRGGARVQAAGGDGPPQGPRWHSSTRLAFRFAFAYFAVYSLVSHVVVYLFLLPNTLPGQGPGTQWPMFELTSWVGKHVFGITEPLVFTGNSRDTNFFWVQAFLVLFVAIIAAGVWSLFDRQRENYVTLHKWFRPFMRLALAAQMIYFGMVKIIPTQFPAPSLLTLVAPVGNLSLQGLLWTSIGASPPYQIFTGVVELVGGLLLLAPRTTMLGATICLASMMHVFVINMSYDVGVKILSFELALMSLFLLAPDFPRLANLFVFNRPAGASTEPELFRTRRANRIALAVQITFGLYLVALYGEIGRTFWRAEGGGGSPKSPLYGIWNVEELSIDGAPGPPQLNDYDRRWRRIIFDAPQWIFFQRTDDSFVRYGVSVDPHRNTFAMTKGNRRSWHSTFTFERPSSDRLILDGHMDGYRINVKLQLVEFDTFRLLNSRFRWVRPADTDRE
jgi:hypothetical protein